MLDNPTLRVRFSIAQDAEEASVCAHKIGYPVLCIPFGMRDIPEAFIVSAVRVGNEGALIKIFPQVSDAGEFGLVHIIKALPIP